MFIDVVGDLTILQFWTFAGDIFDAREAKRLFGLIAGGSAVSNVLFGAVLAGTARAVDPADLLFGIAPGCWCAWAVLYIVSACRQELPAEAPSSGASACWRESLRGCCSSSWPGACWNASASSPAWPATSWGRAALAFVVTAAVRTLAGLTPVAAPPSTQEPPRPC